MKTIIFATCNEQPQIQPGDTHLVEAFVARGATVTAAPWNGAQAPFSSADAIVVRSTWDYPQTPDAFIRWLSTLEGRRQVVNP
ncbi:MAG: hypothetical protein ACX939_13340, partial [Hyphococcus sp.]